MSKLQKPTDAMIEADRIRAVLADPSYQRTIGAWLSEELLSLPARISDEDDPIKGARLRGRYQAINEIFQRIESVLNRADIDSRKIMEN